MTSLDDLRKLGEFPAVEEYRRQADGPAGEGLSGYLKDVADAAIEELAEAVIASRAQDFRTWCTCDKAHQRVYFVGDAVSHCPACCLKARAERAEADFRRALDDEEKAKQRAIEAEAEVARSKLDHSILSDDYNELRNETLQPRCQHRFLASDKTEGMICCSRCGATYMVDDYFAKKEIRIWKRRAAQAERERDDLKESNDTWLEVASTIGRELGMTPTYAIAWAPERIQALKAEAARLEWMLAQLEEDGAFRHGELADLAARYEAEDR